MCDEVAVASVGGGFMKLEVVADLCTAIAEFIASAPQGAEMVARKLGQVLQYQAQREHEERRERDERERVTGKRY